VQRAIGRGLRFLVAPRLGLARLAEVYDVAHLSSRYRPLLRRAAVAAPGNASEKPEPHRTQSILRRAIV